MVQLEVIPVNGLGINCASHLLLMNLIDAKKKKKSDAKKNDAKRSCNT